MKTDDPKFTAHALGETDDLTPQERAEIEALLREDARAGAESADLQNLATLLRRELKTESAVPLSAEQRTEVLAAAGFGEPVTEAKVIPFPRRAAVLSAIAACVVVGLSIALLDPLLNAEKEAARKALASAPQPAEPGINVEAMLKGGAFHPEPPPDMSQQTMLAASDPTQPATIPAALEFAKKQGSLVIAGGTVAEASPLPASAPMPLTALHDSPLIMEVSEKAKTMSNKGEGRAMDASAPAENGAFDTGTAVAPLLEMASAKAPSAQAAAQPMLAATPAPMPVSKGDLSAATGGRVAMTRGGAALAPDPAEPRPVNSFNLAKALSPAPAPDFDGLERDKRRGNDARAPEEEHLRQLERGNTGSFDAITDNAFLAVRENPLSTFSIDVDTASYAIVRRFLNEQQLPPKGAVRIEELLNYFTYDYPQPQGDAPFSSTMEVATCPWTPGHRLVRIGIKGREIAKDKRPASNLVFLIDVSGSMQPANKLPLLKESLGLLIDQLGAGDEVAMVVYAGSSGCVLEPTHDKAKMRRALEKLEAGGSTNGANGIQLAYQLAEKSFIKGGTNRVILATDGDWNVGVTNQSDLLDMIAKKAKGGVFLTVLGFGMDNLKDSMLVKLADKGNGNYAYIDTLLEAKKVFADQLSSTLVTIAKDVKIQVEFNPLQVAAYRLIGYEKRLLAKEDFNDDTKDAGEIGAGHTVTALYEVVPAGKDAPVFAKVDALKYQQPADKAAEPERKAVGGELTKELLTLKLRYKAPDGDTSKLLEFPLIDTGVTWERSSRDFRFAAAVASYGMLLRDSPHKGTATWNSVRELAVEGKGEDASGYRTEFLSLLEKAKALTR